MNAGDGGHFGTAAAATAAQSTSSAGSGTWLGPIALLPGRAPGWASLLLYYYHRKPRSHDQISAQVSNHTIARVEQAAQHAICADCRRRCHCCCCAELSIARGTHAPDLCMRFGVRVCVCVCVCMLTVPGHHSILSIYYIRPFIHCRLLVGRPAPEKGVTGPAVPPRNKPTTHITVATFTRVGCSDYCMIGLTFVAVVYILESNTVRLHVLPPNCMTVGGVWGRNFLPLHSLLLH